MTAAQLRRFAGMPSSRRRLLVLGALLQSMAALSLRAAGLPRTIALADRCPSWLQRDTPAGELRWALEASAGVVGGSCLTKALAARAMAGRRCRLTVAVGPAGPDATTPEFHAWTDVNGAAIPATAVERYVPLAVWN